MHRESCAVASRFFSLLVLVPVLASCFMLSCVKQEGPSVGNLAPDFVGPDLSGKQISLSDYRGKVVLLDFWATWCPGCVEELPQVKRVYDRYRDQDFVVVGIDLDQNPKEVENFVRVVGIDWPQVFDGSGAIANRYNVKYIPATFLIDKNGVIRYTSVHGQAELERAVRDVLRVPLNTSPAS